MNLRQMKVGQVITASVRTAGLILFNKSKLLLIKSQKGYWDLPKGRLDKGEKSKEAALREAFEETGISNIKLLTGKKFDVGGVTMKFFISTTPTTTVKFAKNPESGKLEHTEAKWVYPHEARSLLRKDYKQLIDWVEETL